MISIFILFIGLHPERQKHASVNLFFPLACNMALALAADVVSPWQRNQKRINSYNTLWIRLRPAYCQNA